MTALSDLCVLDLSQHVAGPFCTKLFADFGADVIKVEPPGQGDTARTLGPFPDGEPNLDASGVFLYLNTNKRSITLNLETSLGRDLLRDLVMQADIVVENFNVGTMVAMGLDFDTLETLRPGVILTSITPFGQTGPWRQFQATDLITHATSGLSAVNRAPDGPPLREPGHQTDYQGGAFAFVSTMSAVCYQRYRAGWSARGHCDSGSGGHHDCTGDHPCSLRRAIAGYAVGFLAVQRRLYHPQRAVGSSLA